VSIQSPQPPRNRPRKRVPVGTWIGVVATALLALMALPSTGFWGMVLMASLVVLITAAYGLAFRRATWLRLPRRRSAAAVGIGVALAVLIGSTSAYGVAHPETALSAETATPRAAASKATDTAKHLVAPSTRTPDTSTPTPTPTATPTPTPVVVTKNVTETVAVPFPTTTVQDASLAKGVTTVTTAGRNGVTTKVWRVTTTDGVETGRTLVSQAVTTPPTPQVTSVGTYVAPAPQPAQPHCTNGTYVNSAGNTICRPEYSPGVPAGATARCGDGTYSFSQSRSGTCSRHGGVAAWL